MRAVLKAIYQYAKLNEYIDRDLTEGLVYEWTNSTEQIHDRYSDEEIKTLWSKLYEINNVDIIMIMIYTGLRPTELLVIITPTEPTWTAILIHAWENSKWNTCPTMADTPLLHSWTAPGQMTYVSNWLWDTVWRTTPLKELTPIRLKKNFLQKWTRYKTINRDWLLDTLMMFLMINITPIFSLNHLDKHWMKCFQKHSKSVKISVYHLYITCVPRVYNNLKIT